MIGYIKGTVESVDKDKIILECNGIGYNIFVTATLLNNIYEEGMELKIYTYLSVREDAMILYGFASKDELDIFKMLITVSGIGPKGGLAILSTLDVNSLKVAIVSGDSKAIAKAPTIGAKTASKVILELKDKIDTEGIFGSSVEDEMSKDGMSLAFRQDALDGLLALGFSKSQSLMAIKKAMGSKEYTDAGLLLKDALKYVNNL
ncbi:MAG: Holliday junction branch migration protein RuvA [Lachnospiraceae bacterium]|jgi:Holliday junction DNA helicase RuvA|nr:Holliday junction branch migration protein RuvA [Lachnospiraceae bacterium]